MQRGNRREEIFFVNEDRAAYLSWLKEYGDKFEVEVLAYCLMSNPIHLVVVLATDDGLHRILKPLHRRYAQRINRARGWKASMAGSVFLIPTDDV